MQTPEGYRGRRYQEPNRFWNYPRPNKGPISRWLPSWRFLIAGALGALVLGIGLFIAAYFILDVPEPEDVALAETTTLYYADAETEMGSISDVRRIIIDTGELPEHVGQAIVASEDRRFYKNVGVDPVGIVRAFINNVTGGKRQGASTITQQYVERYYTGDNHGYSGKAKEAILALKIDRQQSKDEILGNYMNTIYFGRGAYGIEKAAQAYFDKPADDLDISESAMLAGIIPAPSAWDPAISPEQAEYRWDRTLDLMVEAEFITQAERDEQELPETVSTERPQTYAGPQGYLLRTAQNELTDLAGFDPDEIQTAGYRVVTTIDPDMQRAAEVAAEDLPDEAPDGLHVGLISLDNATGGIKSMYGGHDYLEQSYNDATQSTAQAGSTFKIYTLLAALENDFTLEDRLPSYTPMQITSDWEPKNVDGRDWGNINLITATQHSINTTYAKLNVEVGPDKTKEMAIRLGLSKDTKGLDPYPSNVLGSASPTVIDNAHAFSTIANGGEKTTPHIIDYVEGPDGSKVYTAPTSTEQVIDSEIAADATYAMTKVIEGGTASTAHVLGRPAAGKTGTSSDNKSAWFVGYVPQVTTAVALFQQDEDGNEVTLDTFGGYQTIYGGSWPTTIWTQYMLEAVKDLPVEEFPERSTPVPVPQPPAQPQPSQPDNDGDDHDDDSDEEDEDVTEEDDEEEPDPSPSPTKSPSPSPTESPTQSPSPSPTKDPDPSPTQEPEEDPDSDGESSD